MTITINNTELELFFAGKLYAGHGHQKIAVTFYNTLTQEGKQFTSTTNNMIAFDAAEELEGDERRMALYEIIAADIQDQLEEFVSPLINN